MNKKLYSDSRWWDNPQAKDVQCNSCTHYRGFAKCDAFPDRIPRELMTIDITHDKPYEGDGGVRYKHDPDSRYISNSNHTKK